MEEIMKFTKMHGIGNDYVYVSCLEETVKNPEKTAEFVSDRHFGIGSDGLVLIKPSEIADFEMAMYNADGSRSEMCGNAIRCVAKYVYDRHLTDKTRISIETLAGIKYADLTIKDKKAVLVRVDMGKPELVPGGNPGLLRDSRQHGKRNAGRHAQPDCGLPGYGRRPGIPDDLCLNGKSALCRICG